jgi:hypothetical protein
MSWRPVAGDTAMRQAITAATQAIDQELRNDPAVKGESREGEDRACFVPPLGVLFDIDTAKRVVRIWHVWCFAKRHPG